MATNSRAYFFRLTPIGKFFFGNERTFGQGEEANYFVRSNVFPQQTSIVGMLRLELLKNGEGTFPISDDNFLSVKDRIGEASFNHEEQQKFGILNQLSPVFICKGKDDVYFPKPFNHDFLDKTNSNGKAFRMGLDGEIKEITLPTFPTYGKKSRFSDGFQNLANSCLSFDGVFVDQNQIGIQKPDEEKTKNESNKGFYKQFYYKFRKGFSFCFWATFDEPINWQPTIVFLGADRSAFHLEAVEANWEKDYKEKYIPKVEFNKPIALLSDTYVSDDFYEQCEFAISKVIDFRYIVTTLNSTNDYSSKSKPQKTNVKLQLLQRGTVIYPKSNQTELEKQLNNPIFQSIGYNTFKNL